MHAILITRATIPVLSESIRAGVKVLGCRESIQSHAGEVETAGAISRP